MDQTETGKVELKFSSDSRLLAGVCGAVNHLAEVSGMDESGRAAFVAAMEDACNEAFHQLPGNSGLVELSLAAVDGHIEAVLTFHEVAAKSDRAQKIQRTLSGRIDRVTQDSRGEPTRLTLVKNLTAPGPKR